MGDGLVLWGRLWGGRAETRPRSVGGTHLVGQLPHSPVRVTDKPRIDCTGCIAERRSVPNGLVGGSQGDRVRIRRPPNHPPRAVLAGLNHLGPGGILFERALIASGSRALNQSRG
jgi:hypothetical protein